MGICTGCGNHISHGICYVCERNERDIWRSGRRRPIKSRHPIAQVPAPTSSRKCPICGRVVRSDRLKSHMWHAHSLHRYSTREERRLAYKSSEQETEPKSKQEVREIIFKKCQICGCSMPLDLVVTHKLHHEREKMKREQVAQSSPKKIRTAGKKRRATRDKKSGLLSEEKQRIEVNHSATKKIIRDCKKPQSIHDNKLERLSKYKRSGRNITQREQREGINNFLSAVFNQPTLLSQILQKHGLEKQHVNLLRQKYLDAYITSVIRGWIVWWHTILDPQCVVLLINDHHLVRGQVESSIRTQYLNKYSTTQQEIYRATAIDSLRKNRHKAKLEQIAVNTANDLMRKTPML